MMKKKSKRARDIENAVSEDGMTESFKDALKADKHFSKYRNIVKYISENLDLDALAGECKRLHSGRKSRTLVGTLPSGDTLLEAQLQDSSNRGRLTQIRAELVTQEGALDESIETIRSHITFTYSEMIPVKTKVDRIAYLNQYLRKGVQLRQRIQTMGTVIELYLKDIDQMSYTFTNSVKILEMIYSRNGR
jgi:hypothetical protein